MGGAPSALWRLAAGLVAATLAGDPLQSALVAGPWRRLLSRVQNEPFDLVVWLLARLYPHVEGRLPDAPVVVDYIDALSEAARQAATTDPSLFRRTYWRFEAPRLESAEQAAALGAAGLVATTPFDAAHLPRGTRAIPNGVVIGPTPPEGPRGPVVAFSGRLRYRPNELAVKRLVERIWPRVVREVPGARLLLGGADAPDWLKPYAGRDGIEVESPVVSMPAFLRRAAVVAAPVTLGTGTPNKVYEAFEAGCAVVASPEVRDRAHPAPVLVAGSDDELASALAGLLADPPRAAEAGAKGRAFVEEHADRRLSVLALGEVYRAALRTRVSGGAV